MMIAQSQDLQKGYAMRFSPLADYRSAVWQILVDDYFQRRIGQDKDILDLGCGWGEFINKIQGRRKWAMDLNPDSADRVGTDVRFLQQDCSKSWQVPDNSLDIVFTSNFFEHLPSKQCLLDTLRQAWRCLRPGGRIIAMGPNIRHVGDAYWDFFDHYIELSDQSLAEGFRMADFEVESSIPRFLPYTMAKSRRPPLQAVRLYIRMPICWRFFGQQFLVTGRKP